MGSEATKAVRTKQRESAARVERLIRKRDERAFVGSARQQRIRAAVRDGRVALRALATAERAVVAAQERVGKAIAQIVGEGLSRNDAYAALELTRPVGTRLLQLAERAARRFPDEFSTGRDHSHAAGPDAADGETGSPAVGGSSTEGNT